MTYKTILVCLTTQANVQRLTRTGCLLAEKFDAHLVGIQKQVIEESGRPVIVVPNTVEPKTIGTSILIGWSAKREATRALHAAIPFARDGGKASIIRVTHSRSAGSHLSHTAHEIAAGLDRHGVETTVTHWDNVDISIGDAILNEAHVIGADLIVSGAFGHSRIYDFAVGATTTHLLQHMTVPILFSNWHRYCADDGQTG